MTWTKFTDMQTGGHRKTGYKYIFIDGDSAVDRFETEFGRDPYEESCECCDADFAVSTFDTLEQATAYARDCRYDYEREIWVDEPADEADAVEPLDEFVNRAEVRVIHTE